MATDSASSQDLPGLTEKVLVPDSDWYSKRKSRHTLVLGDSLVRLAEIPSESVDMAITSPPYWGQRQYDAGGIGLEKTQEEFIENLLSVFTEVKRVLTPGGSFWLNIGDTYEKKSLQGIPWRIALRMIDEQGWTLRNDVVWSKLKGGGAPKDRLRSTHEMIFHFVKRQKYYYDADAIRITPRSAKVVNGAVISATGVSGVRYRRRIELSTSLTSEEKRNANKALDAILAEVADGTVSDFRMVIRGGGQRTTHSNQTRVSGRAKELQEKGFYFLRYNPKGSMPSDVWEIVPEDTQQRDEAHYAAYPVELCLNPIAATCPPDGLVLDPFAGTGTTSVAAQILDRQSIGIDISESYIKIMDRRILEARP